MTSQELAPAHHCPNHGVRPRETHERLAKVQHRVERRGPASAQQASAALRVCSAARRINLKPAHAAAPAAGRQRVKPDGGGESCGRTVSLRLAVEETAFLRSVSTPTFLYAARPNTGFPARALTGTACARPKTRRGSAVRAAAGHAEGQETRLQAGQSTRVFTKTLRRKARRLKSGTHRSIAAHARQPRSKAAVAAQPVSRHVRSASQGATHALSPP